MKQLFQILNFIGCFAAIALSSLVFIFSNTNQNVVVIVIGVAIVISLIINVIISPNNLNLGKKVLFLIATELLAYVNVNYVFPKAAFTLNDYTYYNFFVIALLLLFAVYVISYFVIKENVDNQAIQQQKKQKQIAKQQRIQQKRKAQQARKNQKNRNNNNVQTNNKNHTTIKPANNNQLNNNDNVIL